MLTRTCLSDETLLGYSMFFAMAATTVLVLMGLGVFAYSESRGDGQPEVDQPMKLRLTLELFLNPLVTKPLNRASSVYHWLAQFRTTVLRE